MKKVIVNMLIVSLVLSVFSFTTIADESDWEIMLVVDDQLVETDVPPMMIEERVMVPLRVLAEMLGCYVEWDDSDQSIVVYDNGRPILVMTINDPYVTVNWYDDVTGDFGGDNILIDVPPVLYNERTLVPVRFIAESLGYVVEWNEAEWAVFMYSPWYDGESY